MPPRLEALTSCRRSSETRQITLADTAQGNQPLFALFKKSADHTNIVAADADFRSDFVIVVATAAQGADVVQQVYCSVLPSRAILNKTHNQTVAFLGLNHNCWNFCLAELNECFDTALAANEVVVRRISFRLSRANGDRTLEAIRRTTSAPPSLLGRARSRSVLRLFRVATATLRSNP